MPQFRCTQTCTAKIGEIMAFIPAGRIIEADKLPSRHFVAVEPDAAPAASPAPKSKKSARARVDGGEPVAPSELAPKWEP